MWCKNCGSEIPDGSKFCRKCGNPVWLKTEDNNTVLEVYNKPEGKKKFKHNKRKGLLAIGCAAAGIFLAVVFTTSMFISICLFEAIDNIETENSISYDSTADKDGIPPQGSVQFLEGNTILVSIYISSNNFWSDEKSSVTRNDMNIAVKYIEDCGKKYNKKVNLIYDDGINNDLQYSMIYENALYDSEKDNYEFDKVFNEWIAKNIPIEKLKEKYNTQSIGYIIFLDSDGVSYTIAHFMQDKKRYFNEYSVIYLYEDKNKFEVPSVYAHEILHLFGAVDLYKESKCDGISLEFVQYVDENYPDEIMYTTYEPDFRSNYNEITQQMSDITAYMVGLTDDFYELNQYPEMAKDCRACFSRY